MTEKVRFAPSPTGFLHIGGARTALFNQLFARHNNGTFVLRIEDTDLQRSTQESVDAIFEGMKWLGLDWDEGPFYQTERMDIYKKYIDQLLSEGKAYRCYCTAEELDKKRTIAKSEKRNPVYDRTCRDRTDTPDAPFVIRIKSPVDGAITFDDLIKGTISINNSELDDFIIARSDGSPTYNFTVVVDDYLMGITKVIRGDDHINNTPKQIILYNALNWDLPQFAHVPMILGADKSRLSKRHGATSVTAYRDMGYLSEAVVNYLVRLGWGHGDQEIFTFDELIELFTLDNIGKSAAVFNPEKLIWMNQQYIKAKSDAELAELVLPFLRDILPETNSIDREKLLMLMPLLKERAKLLPELADHLLPYFISCEEIAYDEKGFEKFIAKSPEFLDFLLEHLPAVEKLDQEHLTPLFEKMLAHFEVKFVKIAQALRMSLTGRTFSPGIFEIMDVLGMDECLKRIKQAREKAA